MTLTRGPHAGSQISDLPDYVLYGLLEQDAQIVRPRRLFANVRAAIECELARRGEVRRAERRAA